MEFNPCIICGSDNYRLLLNLSDRLKPGSDEIFDVVECECGFIYLNPRPDTNEIREYYQSDDYDPHVIDDSDPFHKIYSLVRQAAFRKKYRDITRYLQSGKLLDIGGGKGDFCQFMKYRGWTCSVVERDNDAARDLQDLDISYYQNLSEIPVEESYDLITLWHSLEHIHEIDYLFNDIRTRLSADGICVIAVPNIQAFERRFYPDNWAPYDAPRHLYHFTLDTLQRLVQKYGLKIVDTKPLLQDTPYNILLSQEIPSISGYLNAIFQTLQTWTNIFFHGNQYASSLEVICKKQ